MFTKITTVLLVLIGLGIGPSANAQETRGGSTGQDPTAVGESSDWLSTVQQGLAAEEYHVTWQDGTHLAGMEAAWQAPNRAHDLRTYFAEEGVRVVQRTESEPSWQWDLSLIGYGRGDEVSAVGRAMLSPHENEIRFDRGPIVEWYVNDRHGLEQGFTLDGPPEESAPAGADGQNVAGGRGLHTGAKGAREPAAAFLVLALQGSLSPVISEDGQAIDFVAPAGAAVLHYSKLTVTDAGGRELPAWIEGFAEAGQRGIRIVFEDDEAVYPVTVDPLLTSPAWTAEGNQATAHFGCAVSTAGDVNGDGYADVIVGAHLYDNGERDEGRAFVYHGSAAGLSASANWTAEGDQFGAWFGSSVSTAGDVNGDGYADVIVAANYYDNGQTNEGRAYVYHGSATGLSVSADWMAEGDQTEAYFGRSVSTAGDVNGDGYADVIVGAYHYENGELFEGRAFVYHGSAAGLSISADWTAESDQVRAFFGSSVSTAGDVNGDGYADVIVGAHGYDNGEVDEGRAFVYYGSAAGLSIAADWTAEGDQDDAGFGASVSTAGDVNGDGYADVVVGASSYDNGEPNEGKAFVYLGSAAGLSISADWTAESDQVDAYFGQYVSTAGDVNGDGYADVIVGSRFYSDGESDEGGAFVYHGSAAGLSASANWTAEGDQIEAWFGSSVSTAGDVNGDGYADVIVGAYQYDNGEPNEGKAFVYNGSAAGPSNDAAWTNSFHHQRSSGGNWVGTAGDVNGDGHADVIIGIDLYDNGEVDEGRVFVYHGSVSGLSESPAWTQESDQADSYFGYSVGTAGDVNGDGYADVIVGAVRYDSGEIDEGRAYVYHGSASGLSPSPAWTAESNQTAADFGQSVATAGDVNGDGYADVIVGAPNYDGGERDEGRTYVFHGSASGLSPNPAWTAEGDQVDAWFGASASTAGDVNGDGYADVVVDAVGYASGEMMEGRAHVYHGSASGLSPSPDWTAENGEAETYFGRSAGTAGDVNGDGYADVIVGAPHYSEGQPNAGRAYVYHGSASGLSPTPTWTAESDDAEAYFGYSVGTAGDVNGDGYADVLVGEPGYGYPTVGFVGGVYVYHGSAAGLATTAAEFITTPIFESRHSFGASVATAGDVTGDGYADVVVGAHDRLYGHGEAFLYYGNEGRGASLRPQLRRRDDSSPVVDGGWSHDSGGFRLACLARSPFGRGRVKLEWEVKPRGVPFDGVPTGRSDVWVDTGTAGASLNELVSGLAEDGYHWRVRLLYDPATLPFQQASRWFTVPWNGWNETDVVVGVPTCFAEVCNGADDDCDGLIDEDESGQAGDPDGDGLSGLCDACPYDFDNDIDGDGVCGDVDNCPTMWNALQLDQDNDGLGDVCDVCLGYDDTADCNGNGTPDGCDIGGAEDGTLDGAPENYSAWAGASVAIRGDVALVGVPRADHNAGDPVPTAGAVHVFRRDYLDGTWELEEVLHESPAAENNNFGYAVSLSADVAVVGAHENDAAGSNAGAAYVFRYSGGSWLEEAELVRTGAGADHHFGFSVAVDGDVAVVGALWANGGTAYVFRHSGGTWSQEAELQPGAADHGKNFGASVAVDGNVVVVGMTLADSPDTASGAAVVYRFANGSWTEQARLSPAVPSADWHCGGAVSIHNVRAVMGCTDGEEAYVYRFDPDSGQWPLESALRAHDHTAGDEFGTSVAVNGDRILVGADADDDLGVNSGSVYVFRFDTIKGLWRENAKWTPFDGAEYDYFGTSTALDGDTAIVGATGLDGAHSNSGGAYIYHFSDDLLGDCDLNGTPDDCQPDTDGDGLIDVCDPCPANADSDLDGVCDGLDNCVSDSNPTQVNSDTDDHGDACDCAPLDGDVYPGAAEVNDGKDNQCPGDPGYGTADEIISELISTIDEDTFCWPAQIGASRYQIARSTDDQSFASDCTVAEETGTCHTDTEDPPPGSVFYYLVRALEPNSGSWGTDGNGDERNFACGAVSTSPENMASAHDRIVNDATVGVVGNAGPGSPNRLLYLDGEIPGPPPGNWGLDRSNQQTLPLDQNGSVSGTGDGVHIYVLDSGIHRTHQEFTGRANCFFDWEQGNDCADGNGHGTWVASLVAGETYGWANDAMVHAVRVLNNIGVGSEENIKAGLDAIAAGGEIPGVVVYPLSSGASVEIDAAVRRVIDAGFYVVAQANNSDADACNGSPARVPEILTVGATDSDDGRTSFSNWGSCVDLFAPGGDIAGAWHTSDTATETLSGTEAAAAFVAGAVAIHAERGNLLANEPGTGGTP